VVTSDPVRPQRGLAHWKRYRARRRSLAQRADLHAKGSPVVPSISVKVHQNINGIDQGMFITGTSSDNPLLLFVHGGPGMPM